MKQVEEKAQEREQRKGFILTANHSEKTGEQELKFFGTSDDGPFLITITDNRPVFFIERSVHFEGATKEVDRKKVSLKTSAEKDVDALYFKTQSDLISMKESLHSEGKRTYESDVRPVERYLMERFINGGIEFRGECKTDDNGITYFINPQIRPAQYTPQLSVLSLDIETSMENDLYSIGLHQKSSRGEIKKVFMVGEERETRSETLEIFKTERDVFLHFLDFIAFNDPDIIIGWHVIGFDLSFLERKSLALGIPFNLGRLKGRLQIFESAGMGYFAKVDGRIIVDGPQSLRAAFFQFENFKLETVAQKLLGVGKDIAGTEGKIAEIERRFRQDKAALAKYNLLDCTLVHDIYEKVGLLDLLIARSQISGLLIDKIGLSTAAFDHFYLPHFHRKGLVAPNILDVQRESGVSGGYVVSPSSGAYDHVIVLDFKSLYPSIIRTFKIDPFSRIKNSVDPIHTPNGLRFSSTQHILPSFITELMARREEAKACQNKALSQSIKILMNSFYGVMGSTGSRFYHSDLPHAITDTGQWLLKQTIQFLQGREFEVLYGDTDSVFIQLKHALSPFKQGEKIAREINFFIANLLAKKFKVESHLEVEFEKYYHKFFIPPARSSGEGVKKKYAGLKMTKTCEELEFVGMEVVRSDWTKLAKKFQRELFQRFFYEKEIEMWIKDFVDRIKKREYDDLLVYKKRLAKAPEEYIKNIPPHVKAALQLPPPRFGRLKEVYYVISKKGPTPAGPEQGELDYQHYIDKQIRPLADNILFLYNKTFESLIAGDQLSLF